MSKILDGLKRTGGEIADLTIDVIGDNKPAAARKRPPADGNGAAEQHLAQPAAKPAEIPPASGFAYEEPAGDFQAAPQASPDDFPQSLEPADYQALEAEQAAQDDFDLSLNAGASEIPAIAFDSSSASSGPVVIRLQAGSPLLPFDADEAATAAEEYRRVKTRILQHPLQPRLMLVSSPSPGDGKSVTAINIGAALALNPDARVLIVDMDLRRPRMSGLLGLPEMDGIAEVLAGARSLEETIVRLEPFPNLFLLPAGRNRTNPTELVSSPYWKTLCKKFRAQMTYTILDGPPVDAVAEYRMLQEPADGLLLVVRTDHTARTLISSAIESIPKEKLLGSVINGYRKSLFWRHGGVYYS